MTLKLKEHLSLAAVLGLFLLAALASTLVYLRLDMTSTGSFSISPVTKEILKGLQDEMVLTYFVSKELKSNSPIPQALEDLLTEYTASGSGKVRLVVTDPAESDQMQEVQRLGLEPIPLRITSNNTFTQVQTYTGLKVEYQDKFKVIPVLDQPETLEYELTNLIREILGKEKTKFGLLAGNSQYTLQRGFQYLSRFLAENKTLVEIPRGSPIDASLQAVAVLGDQSLNEQDLFYLDQYLMKGGKLLLGIDGVTVDLETQQINASSQTLVRNWLEKLGVKIDPHLVLDGTGSMLQNIGGGMTIPTEYPTWVSVVVNNTSSSHPVTSRFGGLSLLWTSPLTVQPVAGIEVENILWSTPKSWLMKDQFTLDPQMAKFSLQIGGQDTVKSYTLGVSLKGKFTSGFTADTRPAGITDEVVTQSEETRLLVVGDSDFASDLIGQTMTAQGNLQFLDNAIDWLAQDEALLSIKSRPQRDRTLNALKADDGSMAWAYWSLILVNVILVPLGLIAFGLIRGTRRKIREKGGN